jgi:hypothetical protein
MVTKLVSYYELRQTLYGLHPAQKRVLLNDLQADLSAYDASQAINVEAIAPNLPDLSNTPHPVDCLTSTLAANVATAALPTTS